ncbi:LamB/YcsF [Hyphopichia burtonii NRRL Y-1933]|uniref:LamB/YcsF n=1 Tax=Hyphopichia burtonii NRRL Y-1933 TaxID=984485 RepID=A0A1E4RGW7_9ASCO|nr:LamB/YcsF [Hyphopichia burtonii NRRL Y-1933]ODV66500.1 LamB/YcsF [Hyphopichia burtonii NRRL Y-1933]
MVELNKDLDAKTPKVLLGPAEHNAKLLVRHEINCDMGEGFGPWKLGPDEEIMPLIDRANIACAGHAGDPKIMEDMVRLAKKHDVKCGAHVGLPDKEGFGRRIWLIDPEDIYRLTIYQTGALKGFLQAEGVELTHIKPHGELYFYVERDENVMRAVIRAAKVFDVPLVAGKSARYTQLAEEYGVKLIQEFYPDLNYTPEGTLCRIKAGPKSLKTPEILAGHINKACISDEVVDIEDTTLNLGFSGSPLSCCLHSDMPNALGNVKAARGAIDEVNKSLGLSVRK